MGQENRKKVDVKLQRMIAIGILCAACVLLVFLLGGRNRLEQVTVERLDGNYTSITDEEIIRASSLKMGSQIPAIHEIEDSVEKGVNSLGSVRFEDVERIGEKSIRITVSAREPIAVIDSAGTYVLIDKDGVVTDIVKTLPTENLLYVTGCEILTQEKGRRFSVRKQSQLEDIIRITLAIRDGGYSQTYSELNVKDERDIRLITNTSLIVEIYDGTDMENKLMMVDEIIRSGKTTGTIKVSGDYAGYLSSGGG